MTTAERKFIAEVACVSVSLAAWAQECIGNGWSVDDVKVHLRAAAKLAGRE